ncbi:quinone oxidoreductase [Herbiconiux sp. L3-i23]|uniref:quinone oxidoreductase family protein n=1 Tax=Herbiconiux sp. L3-i23 TaxID=2905871 RepID=UPI0020488804|nr:quinone oxidoreductase [Herbiconiux sp. L3-i23]BDI24098.1 quinone oxidoreductase [Herbiconiux sp. L3-i23]
MRAVSVSEYGGPDALHLVDRGEPTPGRDEVLVRTDATGVNFIETYQRSGIYRVPLPFTPGAEASGTVIAAGDDVTTFSVGDRITTAEARATYADAFVVEASKAVRVPDGVDAETAAALPLQGLTAHYLSRSVFRAGPEHTVLLHAGAGGVGLLLTQLLTAVGARVITTVGDDAKAELSRQAGADVVLGYDGVADRVRSLTDGRGVDVVYDGVGRATFDDSLASLAVRGTMVLFGASSGPVPPFDPQRLNAGGSLLLTRPTMGHFLRTPEERASRYRDLFDAVAGGRLRVRVGERFPLAEASHAHRALESRATTGKVLLLP